MADSKKYDGSQWEHSLRKLTTATDTFTTLPVDVYADGNNATVGLKGNMSQTGTPTPSNPIMPQGTGERTGNLYNINAKDVNNGYVNHAQLNQDGTTEEWERAEISEISEYIPINGDTAYTFNGIGSYNSPCYALYDENKQLIGAYKYNGRSTIKFTSPNNARYFRFTHIKTTVQPMMVEGEYTSQTMPAYEPYGYKIPISSASTTTPVYLGEVETTRRVKKLVLTGNEDTWESHVASGMYRLTVNGYIRVLGVQIGLSTHFGGGYPIEAVPSTPTAGTFYFLVSSSGNNFVYFASDGQSTLADWKTYLQQQYAAGTPVTVWYVLATPETGIVNEPLQKIGDYSDSISGISIPTTEGANTITVDTTVQPSEVTATYTGWHDASVKEWDGTDWQ